MTKSPEEEAADQETVEREQQRDRLWTEDRRPEPRPREERPR